MGGVLLVGFVWWEGDWEGGGGVRGAVDTRGDNRLWKLVFGCG